MDLRDLFTLLVLRGAPSGGRQKAVIGSNGTLYTNDGQSVALIGANVPFWIYKRGAHCAGSAFEVTRSRTLGLSCNCRDKAPTQEEQPRDRW